MTTPIEQHVSVIVLLSGSITTQYGVAVPTRKIRRPRSTIVDWMHTMSVYCLLECKQQHQSLTKLNEPMILLDRSLIPSQYAVRQCYRLS